MQHRTQEVEPRLQQERPGGDPAGGEPAEGPLREAQEGAQPALQVHRHGAGVPRQAEEEEEPRRPHPQHLLQDLREDQVRQPEENAELKGARVDQAQHRQGAGLTRLNLSRIQGKVKEAGPREATPCQ